MRSKQQRLLDAMLEGHTIIRMSNGYKVRRKPGPKREQVLEDEAFEGSRKSLSTFLKASSSGKVLRQALREVISTTRDKGMHNRLTSVLCKVLSSTAEDRLQLLRRFELGGARCTLSNTFYGQYRTYIDMASREAVVEVAGFKPYRHLRAPSGATHMRFHMTYAVVDFEAGTSVQQSIVSDAVSVSASAIDDFTLRAQLPDGCRGEGFVAFGVSFYDGDYVLSGGAAVLAEVAAAAPATRIKPSRIPSIAVTFKPSPRRKKRTRHAALFHNRPPFCRKIPSKHLVSSTIFDESKQIKNENCILRYEHQPGWLLRPHEFQPRRRSAGIFHRHHGRRRPVLLRTHYVSAHVPLLE